jgi:hypothetical protein
MYKSFGGKIQLINKTNKHRETKIIASIVVAIALISGLSILSIPIEKSMANPCSGISASGGNGGPGGPGGFGFFNGGRGGDGGSGAPGGSNTVECTFEDVTIVEP